MSVCALGVNISDVFLLRIVLLPCETTSLYIVNKEIYDFTCIALYQAYLTQISCNQ